MKIFYSGGFMKRSAAVALGLLLLAYSGCKKDAGKKEETALAKKYAIYKLNIYQEKDLKKILALISKGESVDLLAIEKIMLNKKEIEIAKIRLSDDKAGYLKAEFLAEKPVIFTENTKAHVRNNSSSDISDTIPKGALGFITGEKGQWAQIFIGNYYDERGNKKYLDGRWVQGGFIFDEKLLPEARSYEDAVKKIYDTASTVKDINQGKTALEELAKGSSIFSLPAKEKLAELKLRQADSPETDLTGENIPPDKVRTVISKGGLRLRDTPDQKGEIITVIPEGEKVEMIEVTGEELTIAGTSGKWSRIRWRDKSGWVFGGFLTAK
jgi:uncharacterized protein YgiM (DUF1202 family)